jgi:hypothetical protein
MHPEPRVVHSRPAVAVRVDDAEGRRRRMAVAGHRSLSRGVHADSVGSPSLALKRLGYATMTHQFRRVLDGIYTEITVSGTLILELSNGTVSPLSNAQIENRAAGKARNELRRLRAVAGEKWKVTMASGDRAVAARVSDS